MILNRPHDSGITAAGCAERKDVYYNNAYGVGGIVEFMSEGHNAEFQDFVAKSLEIRVLSTNERRLNWESTILISGHWMSKMLNCKSWKQLTVMLSV